MLTSVVGSFGSIWDRVLRIEGWDLGCRVWGVGCRVQGVGCRLYRVRCGV